MSKCDEINSETFHSRFLVTIIYIIIQVAAGKKIDVSLKILEDFYMTDSISRASPTMAKCVQAVKAQKAAPYVTS